MLRRYGFGAALSVGVLLALPNTLSAQGNAPILGSIEVGKAGRQYDAYRPTPLFVSFSDPDGDLKGGWLRLDAACPNEEPLHYKIALQYEEFAKTGGTVRLKPILKACSRLTLNAFLIDRSGQKSSTFSRTVDVEAASWLSTASYQLTEDPGLYDDFDGHGALQTHDSTDLAVAGSPSHDLWAVSARNRNHVQIVRATDYLSRPEGRSFVARARNADGWREYVRLFLIRPRFNVFINRYKPRDETELKWGNCGRFEADVLVSSESTAAEFSSGVELSVGVAPFGTDWSGRIRSWEFGLRSDPLSDAKWQAYARYYNGHEIEKSWYRNLRPVEPDTWYTVAIEPVIVNDEIELRMYLDSELLTTVTIEESQMLLTHSYEYWSELARSLIVFKPTVQGDAIAYFDNVYGVYEDRVE